ncbi:MULTISPECIES: hypothetical protein [unclassified Moorena]|uniref:hypothetical protein n=1 Tax=unclassified Moorena TaxID=2683338 RepID=UPI0013BDBF3D|nr:MULTISPECIES: hypothetical protein [unclassified Moorena]NEP34710.1 hypothetical protein [Moorena sp. SIO3B2]NEQ09492.1 hypothetical protein [Moorena sp. SIO4E2]
MFTQFRDRYPQGSLISDLLAIDHGQYIVRCSVKVEGTILVTGLAAAQTVELAEDQARLRALAALGMDSTKGIDQNKDIPRAKREVNLPLQPLPRYDVGSTSASQEQTQPNHHFTQASRTSDTSSYSFSESRAREVRETAANIPSVEPVRNFSNDSFSREVETSVPADIPKKREPISYQTSPPDPPVQSYSQNTMETNTSDMGSLSSGIIDHSDIITKTNVEMKRLGWTTQQGKDYLLQTYGKRSRQLLSDKELMSFLEYLESQPVPSDS